MNLRLFPAFFDRPAKICFANQEEDEYIELLLRRHVVTNIFWILTAVFLIIVPFFWPQINRSANLEAFFTIPFDVGVGLLVIWYMVTAAYIIERFLYWYFNIYIVTNKHLIAIQFDSLLSRTVTESLISDVQSLASPLKGVLGQLFYFGDVIIETAAKRQKIEFLSIPKPDFVADRIQDLQEQQQGDGHAN